MFEKRITSRKSQRRWKQYGDLDGEDSLQHHGGTAGQHVIGAFCHHILEILQCKLDLSRVRSVGSHIVLKL
jgi:hypothetical protein